MKVGDIMRTGERLAKVAPATTVMDALMAMTKAQGGSAVVAGADGMLLGIFTDGDFRRHFSDCSINRLIDCPSGNDALSKSDNAIDKSNNRLIEKFMNSPVSEFMTARPLFVRDDAYAADLLKIFERKHIDDLPVCDADGRVVGLVDLQDLPKMKVL